MYVSNAGLAKDGLARYALTEASYVGGAQRTLYLGNTYGLMGRISNPSAEE
jgi:hypothetical protein